MAILALFLLMQLSCLTWSYWDWSE
ncbi:hypothetical protein GBAR_LOCUS25765 [Geodia barretti]|uniref:Uncharacterized protein n=1 Tax=Geodia barretti TaxID=519541 RepID=A0AA35XBQ0_GEOBA|nr:hypothetical protein GBAR_LOCUS25765 [Geodia barretti]